MNEKEKVTAAYWIEQIRQAAKCFEVLGIDGRSINMILIGLEGVRKEIRKESGK